MSNLHVFVTQKKTSVPYFFSFFSFFFSSDNKDTASKPWLYIAGIPVCQPLSIHNSKFLTLVSLG